MIFEHKFCISELVFIFTSRFKTFVMLKHYRVLVFTGGRLFLFICLSVTSQRLRSEQLTKCCELLQKLRVAVKSI